MMALLGHSHSPKQETMDHEYTDSGLDGVPTTPTAKVATMDARSPSNKDSDRPFMCHEPGCGRRFNRKFTLSEHMKTHTGEKPYVCPVVTCGKRFSTSGNLARHKRLHASIKPFECSIDGCKRSFPNEIKLQQHLKIHLGGKTHMCKAHGCGKSFSTAGNLTRHMKNHHHGAMMMNGGHHADHHGYSHHSHHHQYSNGSLSILHNPNESHSPASVSNPMVVSDQQALYSQATHVPLTSYASLSGQAPPPPAYSYASASQPSIANLQYSFSQASVHEPSGPQHHHQPHHGHFQHHVPGSATFPHNPLHPQIYEDLHAMHPLNHPSLFDDVIQFQLGHGPQRMATL